MTRTDSAPVPLDPARIALIEGPVSLFLAGRDGEGRPTLARGSGCRVAPDGRSVTVYLVAGRAEGLLEGIRAGGAVALVVNRPATHESIQLKAAGAEVGPLGPDDPARVADCRAAWIAELGHMGYAEAFAASLVEAGPDDLVAVTFTPKEAFSQSPGPGAGGPLGG